MVARDCLDPDEMCMHLMPRDKLDARRVFRHGTRVYGGDGQGRPMH